MSLFLKNLLQLNNAIALVATNAANGTPAALGLAMRFSTSTADKVLLDTSGTVVFPPTQK